MIRKDCTTANVERAPWTVGQLRKSLQTHHEGKGGLKGLGGKQLLCLRKKMASATASEDGAQDGYHLGEEVTLELDFMKQANRMSSVFEKI